MKKLLFILLLILSEMGYAQVHLMDCNKVWGVYTGISCAIKNASLVNIEMAICNAKYNNMVAIMKNENVKCLEDIQKEAQRNLTGEKSS